MLLEDVVDDRLPLVFGGAEHERWQLLPNRRPVRGHRPHAAAIDLVQLAGARGRRARHAGQAVVAEKKVLHGDAGGLIRGERDFDAFLRFDRLMNAGPPLAAFAQPARELIDDHDLAVADDVLPVEKHFAADFDRPLDVLVNRRKRHAIHRFGLLQLANLAAARQV